MTGSAEYPPDAPPVRGPNPLIALTRRVEEAERESNRVRRFGVMLMTVGALVLGAMAALIFLDWPRFAGAVPATVEARQFVIRDAEGRSRGVWGVGKDGAAQILLADSMGRTRLRLRVFGDGSSGLSLVDAANQPRLAIGVFPDQTTTLVVADEAGRTRGVFGLTAAGAPSVLFADRRGVTKAGLGVDQRGLGTLTIVDRAGERGQDTVSDPTLADSAAAGPTEKPHR